MKYKYYDDKGKHLHTGDERPLLGTTTIINEIYPPPLAWWASGEALKPLGWRDPKKCTKEEVEQALLDGKAVMKRMGHVTIEEYKAFIKDCYGAHNQRKNEGGKKGRDKHALIERYIKTQMGLWNFTDDPYHPDDGYFDDIKGFVKWAEENVDTFLWSEAHCFSEKLWAGGITDFGFKHKNGLNFIGDAKSGIYHKYYIQTGGYSRQIKDSNGLYDREGNKIMDAPQIDGFMLWDYNKDEPRYLVGKEWVEAMEDDFAHTVKMYNHKDVVGVKELPIISQLNLNESIPTGKTEVH